MSLASSLPIFAKNELKILAISKVLVVSVPFTLRDIGDVFLFPFFESISLMVFQVFIISDLYLSKVYAKNGPLAELMLVLKILLYVLRLIFNVSYSLEAGLVNLSFLYRLSLSLIDRSNRLVIHFDLLCLYLLYLTS